MTVDGNGHPCPLSSSKLPPRFTVLLCHASQRNQVLACDNLQDVLLGFPVGPSRHQALVYVDMIGGCFFSGGAPHAATCITNVIPRGTQQGFEDTLSLVRTLPQPEGAAPVSLAPTTIRPPFITTQPRAIIKDTPDVIHTLRTLLGSVPACLRTGTGDWRRESRKPDADRLSTVLARLLGLRFLEGRIPPLRTNKALAGTSGGRVTLVCAVMVASTSSYEQPPGDAWGSASLWVNPTWRRSFRLEDLRSCAGSSPPPFGDLLWDSRARSI
ncbi:hypothetical protein BDN67DRAFT_981760 [Paxillus ammoniavirescens]|nr:hypothetical protein BDN67DRAFT_981760 [Paxillus ammoniavirescens]